MSIFYSGKKTPTASTSKIAGIRIDKSLLQLYKWLLHLLEAEMKQSPTKKGKWKATVTKKGKKKRKSTSTSNIFYLHNIKIL